LCLFFFWYPATVTTVQDILNILTQIAADQLAESWDNVGLLIGEAQNPATTILLGLDPTLDLLNQAHTIGSELIITHHPAIFHPLKFLRTDQPVGRFIATALQHNISVIGCHTNFDSTVGGVSDVLARAMGVTAPVPLVPGSSCANGCGLGRIGALERPLPADTFIDQIYRAISAPWLLEAGPRPDRVSRVAVCGGSCSDLAETALLAEADVFITSEVKHDVARWAEETGLWIIDGGHFATENPAMPVLQQLLNDRLQTAAMDVQIYIGRQQAPLRLIEP
jgi:dinuclear metal center YbgI/SA1388 family protein